MFDNPDERIRPEAVAAAVDAQAADDAIFSSDTGMSTVWLSRFVTMRGDRRLVGSFNLGSMANAMPQAIGAQLLDPGRQVIAFCGDGGLTMLLGDLCRAPVLLAVPVLHSAGVLSFPLLLVLVALLGVFIAPYFASQRLVLPELLGDDERTVSQANAVPRTLSSVQITGVRKKMNCRPLTIAVSGAESMAVTPNEP